MQRYLYERRTISGRTQSEVTSGRKPEKGRTEQANDGNEAEIYLESRPPEDVRVRSLIMLAVISTRSVDDVRGILLFRGRID